MVIDYLKYLLHSDKTPDGLSEVETKLLGLIEKPTLSVNQNDILERLKELEMDNRLIAVQDFGAGSKLFKGANRKIKSIAKYASIQPKYGQLYASFISEFKMDLVIELGTSFGIGTSFLAKVAKKVVSIEGCPNTAQEALHTFQSLKIKNVDLRVGEFSDILDNIQIDDDKPVLVYLDGNHQELPTLQYFDFFKDYLPENSILIFDDIYWSKGMKTAWKKIRQHPYFSVDLYQIGIVVLTKKDESLTIRKRF